MIESRLWKLPERNRLEAETLIVLALEKVGALEWGHQLTVCMETLGKGNCLNRQKLITRLSQFSSDLWASMRQTHSTPYNVSYKREEGREISLEKGSEVMWEKHLCSKNTKGKTGTRNKKVAWTHHMTFSLFILVHLQFSSSCKIHTSTAMCWLFSPCLINSVDGEQVHFCISRQRSHSSTTTRDTQLLVCSL